MGACGIEEIGSKDRTRSQQIQRRANIDYTNTRPIERHIGGRRGRLRPPVLPLVSFDLGRPRPAGLPATLPTLAHRLYCDEEGLGSGVLGCETGYGQQFADSTILSLIRSPPSALMNTPRSPSPRRLSSARTVARGAATASGTVSSGRSLSRSRRLSRRC